MHPWKPHAWTCACVSVQPWDMHVEAAWTNYKHACAWKWHADHMDMFLRNHARTDHAVHVKTACIYSELPLIQPPLGQGPVKVSWSSHPWDRDQSKCPGPATLGTGTSQSVLVQPPLGQGPVKVSWSSHPCDRDQSKCPGPATLATGTSQSVLVQPPLGQGPVKVSWSSHPWDRDQSKCPGPATLGTGTSPAG